VSIVTDIRDRNLLGAHPAYRDGLDSFGHWLTIHAAIAGEPLDDAGREVFERFAGRPYDPPGPGGWSTVVILSPRRCGKSLFAATQVAAAGFRPGPRNTWCVLVGQDRAGATKSLLATVSDFFDESNGGLLHQTVLNRTAETLELSSGASIAVWPSRPAAVRGIAARIAIIDEADFTSTEGGEDKTRQLVAAIRPAMATVPNSRLILISSPGRVGSFFHRLVSESYGKADPHCLVLKLTTDVNPQLTADYFEAMRTLDPVAYRAEVLGEYVESDGGLYDHQAIANCIVSGRGDLPPSAFQDQRIVCAVDPASGARNGDSFAAILGYREKKGRIVVVASRRWPAPFDPRAVVGEIADLCRSYGVRRCVGDRFGSNLIASLFREAGLEYKPSEKNTSDALLELAPAFGTGSIELPDPTISSVAADLRDDLRAIVRRAGGGRDRADAPRNSRGHCDLAACLGVLFAALPKQKPKPKGALPVGIGGRNCWSIYSGSNQSFPLLTAA
jgi:phage terminase large subunit-like protein